MRTVLSTRGKVSALVVSLGLLAGAHAGAQRVLGMATLAPAGSTWMRTFDAANRELRRRTNGQLALRWYAGGVQGDEAEVVRKIRNGRLDGAALMSTGLGHVYRPVLAFQLPAIFNSPQEFVRSQAALRPEIEAGFARAGFTLINFGPVGASLMFSTRPIRTPEDLRAAHPWRWPDDIILPALYQEVGATGVSLQIPEVLGALQTQRVDVVYASPLAAIVMQWSAHVHFRSERSASGTVGGMVLSAAVFNSLPADQQTALREVTQQFSGLMARALLRQEMAAVETLQQRGVQTVTLDDALRARWLALFSRVRARLAGQIADAAWIERVRAAGQGTP